jgi:hypothetical protein
MTKTIVTVLGVAFIMIGLIGLESPHVIGTHLTKVHNLIHLFSGAMALYFGLRASLVRTRQFAFVFGILYGLLGVVGFIAGVPIIASFHGMEQASTDSHLLQIIPGVLVFGTTDHIVHILSGLLFLSAALPTKHRSSHTDFRERLPQS